MRADAAELRRRVHEELLRAPADAVIDRAAVVSALHTVAPLVEEATFEHVVDGVLADVHGLGPLDALLHDERVTDVMVVGGRGVWIERNGVLIETAIRLSAREVDHLIERVVAPLGLRVDRSSPIVDARLPDGSRVNAVVPPLAVDGPCLSIRRFAARTIPLEDMASPPVAALLRDAVRHRANILISGGTGAGKTTLLNALAAELPPNERVVTVEDAAELRLPLRHVVRLESRPANSEGVGAVSLRRLVVNALRMRPDRIIVGEVRGPEALDMLQAMNTGHEGSMSTCHANTPLDALRRIETMVLMGEVALPLDAVRKQICASIDVVIQIARHSNGARRVVEVAEVVADGADMGVRVLVGERGVLAVPSRRSRLVPS